MAQESGRMGGPTSPYAHRKLQCCMAHRRRSAQKPTLPPKYNLGKSLVLRDAVRQITSGSRRSGQNNPHTQRANQVTCGAPPPTLRPPAWSNTRVVLESPCRNIRSSRICTWFISSKEPLGPPSKSFLRSLRASCFSHTARPDVFFIILQVVSRQLLGSVSGPPVAPLSRTCRFVEPRTGPVKGEPAIQALESRHSGSLWQGLTCPPHNYMKGRYEVTWARFVGPGTDPAKGKAATQVLEPRRAASF